MRFEVRDNNDNTIAVFDESFDAINFAATNSYKVVKVTIVNENNVKEETQLDLPIFLSE